MLQRWTGGQQSFGLLAWDLAAAGQTWHGQLLLGLPTASPPPPNRVCYFGCLTEPEGIEGDTDTGVYVDIDRYFGCSRAVSKSLQVLMNGRSSSATHFDNFGIASPPQCPSL